MSFTFQTTRDRRDGCSRSSRSATRRRPSWSPQDLDRVTRVASEQRYPVVMTFDPPAARRPPRQAPSMLMTAQRLEAMAAAGLHGRPRPLHARDVEVTPKFVKTVPGLDARCEVGSARILFGHDRTGISAAVGSDLRIQGRENRSGPLQGLRGQQHAREAPRIGGQGRRGRRAPRPSLLR